MELYQTHGTTLCGLIREGHLQEASVDEFLAEVHDVSLDEIEPDEKLRKVIETVPHKRWVFTAATREHAERCLRRLGIDDLFDGIIACSSREIFNRVGYVSKHDSACFYAAMDFAGVPRSEATGCVLLDDSATNLKTANAVGWRSVLVGLYGRNGSRVECPRADAQVATLHAIEDVLPDLFQKFALGNSCDETVVHTKGVTLDSKKAVKRPCALKPSDSSPPRRMLRKASSMKGALGA